MKTYLLLLFFSLFFLEGLLEAQVTLSGKVITDVTALPIAGASVYINNTSAGSISNSAGEFSFTVSNVSQGDMIVSSVGYEVLSVKLIMDAGENKKFLCRMVVKQQQLQEILVVSDRTRQRWLAMFRENFLGITEEANACNLKNLDAIYFTKSADTRPNSFHAYCDTPLVIINKMLGYKVSFQLIEFSFEESSGSTYYYGYTRFEELAEKSRYIKNRKDAYYGSTFHFYRALVGNRLADEGFLTYALKKITLTKNTTTMPGNSGPNSKPAESFSAAVPVTAAELVQEDTARQGFFKITIGDKLMVQYKKDPSSRRYLSSRVMLMDVLPVGVRSYITSLVPYYFIDKNGIVEDPLSVRYSGYWMYEKAANMLPYDYQPEILPSAVTKGN